ncbi:hypothetical protein J6590_074854, partial [Homalodisca vitripennis]
LASVFPAPETSRAGVARGNAALPDHSPKWLAPDAHWGLTYRRSSHTQPLQHNSATGSATPSHTQPLQHNSATGSATPWPPNVGRSERRRKKRHPRGVEKIRVRKGLPGKRKGFGSGNPGVASSLSREESLPCSRKFRLPLRE